MPEAIKRIVADINANAEIDEKLTAVFTAGLNAGVMLGKCSNEQAEAEQENNEGR